MELQPIKRTLAGNQALLEHPDCRDIVQMTIDFYDRTGFDPPWISYSAWEEGRLVGVAAFKGKPRAGQVEIAYGTFPEYRHKGIATQMCRQLVRLALQTDSTLRVMARTLPDNAYSAGVLKKNGFELSGTIWDEEDGYVQEWEYNRPSADDPSIGR
jgi:RimJ/RimL family protein N-acetyltransferase